MTNLLLALALIQGTDVKPVDDPAALKSDAAKALRDTAKAGAFSVEGELEFDADKAEMKEMVAEWFEEPPEITGSASAAPFKAHGRVQLGGTRYDVYRDGGTVERITWRGWQEYFDQAADELLTLLDLDALAKAAEEATDAKSLPDGKVGDVECRSIRLTLKPDAVKSYVEIEEFDEMVDETRPKKVELRLWIGKGDGRVNKIEWTVGREEWMEDESTYVLDRIYTVTIRDSGKAKVEIPADVQEILKD